MAFRRRPIMGSDPQEEGSSIGGMPDVEYDGTMPSMAACLEAFQAFNKDLEALAYSNHPQASAARNFAHLSLVTHAKTDIECLAALASVEPWYPKEDKAEPEEEE